MKNTDFMNLSLPEGTDKIDIEILNSDFTAIENLLKQHAIIETMTLNGEGVIIGAIGPYIRLQNIDTVQVSIDIGKETFTLASGENMVIRETAENIGIITSGNVNITYFVNSKTYADKEFYTKEKVDELLSGVEANVEVDAELSETSENPVQNKVITAELANYATTAEVESKVTEKVAEIVAGAPEDFDTLKELSDWLKQHENSAATMNSAIQKNASDISTANTNITKNTTNIATANTAIQKNKTDIETANANITKNTADISTANSAIQQNKTDISTANTNIQKNVDDITVTKNDIAINKTTLGTQCKNLLNPDKHTITRCTEEKDGNTYTVTNAGTWSQWYWFIKGKTGQKYILTFEISELTGDSTLNDIYIKDTSTDASILNFVVRKNGVFSKEFTAVSDGNIRIGWCPNNSGTDRELSFKVSNFMCRSADITDSTYEPYMPSLQEQINTLLSVKTYNQTCFTKDETQTNLNVRTDMYLKENAFAWMFNPHITSISKIPANTRTAIGTVSPPPPRRIIKQNVVIHKDDNSAKLTDDATIDIFTTGVVHITSPVAIREGDVTGDYGRININTCFLEAIKFDFVAATTTEGGE